MLGLAISVQPTFDALWGFPGGLYEQGLGEDRAWAMNPFGDLRRRGLEIGAGSDSPITILDPLVGVEAFTSHHDPAQRLTRAEAVWVSTLGGHVSPTRRTKREASSPASTRTSPFTTSTRWRPRRSTASRR